MPPSNRRCAQRILRRDGWLGALLLALSLVVLVPRSPGLASGPAGEAHTHAQTKCFDLSAPALRSRAIVVVRPSDPLLNQARVDATVYVRVVVGPTGHVSSAALERPANPFLARVCLRAARRWRFRPLVRHGKRVCMQGDIVFHIKR